MHKKFKEFAITIFLAFVMLCSSLVNPAMGYKVDNEHGDRLTFQITREQQKVTPGSNNSSSWFCPTLLETGEDIKIDGPNILKIKGREVTLSFSIHMSYGISPSISGRDSGRVYTVSLPRPGVVSWIGIYGYEIDYGDGSTESIGRTKFYYPRLSATITCNHTYSHDGTYLVRVRAAMNSMGSLRWTDWYSTVVKIGNYKTETLTIEYTFDEPVYEEVVGVGVDPEFGLMYKKVKRVTIPGCDRSEEFLKPVLPVKPFKILLPPYRNVKEIRVTPEETRLLEGIDFHYDTELTFATYGLIDSNGNRFFTGFGNGLGVVSDINDPISMTERSNLISLFIGDTQTYIDYGLGGLSATGDEIKTTSNYAYNYPSTLYSDYGTQYKRGFPIRVLYVYPIQIRYMISGGVDVKAYFHKKIKIEIVLGEDENKLHPMYRGYDRDFDAVAEIVDNPQVLDLYRSLPTGVKTGKPKMLIIAPVRSIDYKFDYYLQELANAHKIYQDIECEVEFLSGGRDSIRDYIASKYKEGFDYVLLVGDDNYDFLAFDWRGPRLSDNTGKPVTFPNYRQESIPTYQVPAYWQIASVMVATILNCTGMQKSGIIKVNRTKVGGSPVGGPTMHYSDEDGDTIFIETQESDLNNGNYLSDVTSQQISSDLIDGYTDLLQINESEKLNQLLDIKYVDLFDKLTEMGPLEIVTEDGESVFVNPISIDENGLMEVEILGNVESVPSNEENCEYCNKDIDSVNNNYNISTSASIPTNRIYCKMMVTIIYLAIPFTTSSDYPYACLDDFVYHYRTPTIVYAGMVKIKGDTSPEEAQKKVKKIEELAAKCIDELPYPKDLFAEVYVGRAPVNTQEEVRNFVTKTISYLKYQSTKTDKDVSKALMIGEYLGFLGEENFGFYSMEELIDGCKKHGYTTTGIPSDKYKISMVLNDEDLCWLYEYGIPKEVAARYVLGQINLSGYDLINHLGHSSQIQSIQLLSQIDRDYQAAKLGIKEKNGSKLKKLLKSHYEKYKLFYDLYNHVQNLENLENTISSTNNKPFILYSQGCLAGAFDWPDYYPNEYYICGSGSPDRLYPSYASLYFLQGDSVGEGFIEIESGAAAVIMNTFYGFGNLLVTDGPSQAYHREFIDAIFGEGKTKIGEALQDAREDNIIRLKRALPYRILQYGITLLGDPALEIRNPSKSLETAESSTPSFSIDIKQANEFGEGPIFQEKGLCIDAVVSVDEELVSQQSVVADEISIDYDQDLVEVTNAYATVEGTSISIKGEDDGDAVRWRNVRFDKLGSSFNNLTIHIDGKAKKHVISQLPYYRIYTIDSTLYVICNGNVQKKTATTVVWPYTNLEHLPKGIVIEKKIKKANEDDSAWRESLSAKVGDKIDVRIEITNTGENVINGTNAYIIGPLTDYLPKGVRYVEGSTRLTASFPELEVKEIYVPPGIHGRPGGLKKIGIPTDKWVVRTVPWKSEVFVGYSLHSLKGEVLYEEERGSLTYHEIKDMFLSLPNYNELENLLLTFYPDINQIAINMSLSKKISLSYLSPDKGSLILEYTVEVIDSGELNIDGTIDVKHDGDRSAPYSTVDRRITIYVEPEATLYCSTSYYDFGSVKKGEKKTTYIQIRNTNEGSKLRYTLTPKHSWVTVYPSSGISLGESDTIAVTADTSDLPVGEYTSYIDVSSNGGNERIQIRLNVVDSSNPTPPDNPPTSGSLIVRIIKPLSHLYVRDKELMKLKRISVVIGAITIKADVTAYNSFVERVEFIIDDEVKNVTYAAPYQYTWNERAIGFRKIKVRAYDSEGNTNEAEANVIVINLVKNK